jgi:serine O-acetyltransferase
MNSLTHTIQDIKNDIPESRITLKILFINYLYNPSFRVLLNHRLGKHFYKSNNFFLRQLGIYYKVKMITKRNCDFSYNSIIGKNLKMPHPIGVVIGDGVVIKNNVTVFQQVTFGSHGKKSIELAYPVIEDGVKIYAGAKIIGGITIGENAVIGANSVVNIDVPPNTVAVGIPCRIIPKEK